MATVNQPQHSSRVRDQAVASSSNTAQTESAAVPGKSCPVLLRLADVSLALPAAGLVQISPLALNSAFESLGSGMATAASEIAENAQAGAAALSPESSAYASLLAASPSLTRSPLASTNQTIAQPQSGNQTPTQTTWPHTVETSTAAADRAFAAVPVPAESVDTQNSAATTSTGRAHQRIDKPILKPVRRQFRVSRPAWLPEVPPTLVLGLLICFSGLLVGMLWRGSETDSLPNLAPAAQDQAGSNQSLPVNNMKSGSQFAVVPEVPQLRAGSAAGQATQKPVNSQPAQSETAAAPSTKKVSQAKGKAKAATAKTAAKAAAPHSAPVTSISQNLPAPQITGIRPLPPVDANPTAAYYGQTLGRPAPHIVDNPFAGRQGDVYEARRPSAQFQGTITKPDAVVPHERY